MHWLGIPYRHNYHHCDTITHFHFTQFHSFICLIFLYRNTHEPIILLQRIFTLLAFLLFLQHFDIFVTEKGLRLLFTAVDYQHRNSIGGEDLWRLAFVETLEKPRGHGEGNESDVPLSAMVAGGTGGGAGGGGGGSTHDHKDVRRPSLLKAGSIRHPKGSLSLSGKQISGKFALALGQGLGGLMSIAVKHTGTGGSVRVHSDTHEEEGEHDSRSRSPPPSHLQQEEEVSQHAISSTNTSTHPSQPSAVNLNTHTTTATTITSSSRTPTKLTPLKEDDSTTPVGSPTPTTYKTIPVVVVAADTAEEKSGGTELIDVGGGSSHDSRGSSYHTGSTPPGNLATNNNPDTHALDATGKGVTILSAAVRDRQSSFSSSLPTTAATHTTTTTTSSPDFVGQNAPVKLLTASGKYIKVMNSAESSQNPSQTSPVKSLTASQKMAMNFGWEPSFPTPTPTTLPPSSRMALPQHVMEAMTLSGITNLTHLSPAHSNSHVTLRVFNPGPTTTLLTHLLLPPPPLAPSFNLLYVPSTLSPPPLSPFLSFLHLFSHQVSTLRPNPYPHVPQYKDKDKSKHHHNHINPRKFYHSGWREMHSAHIFDWPRSLFDRAQHSGSQRVHSYLVLFRNSVVGLIFKKISLIVVVPTVHIFD